MLEHAVLAVRRDDRQLCAEARIDAVLVRKVHCARMEGDDLVVVEVRGDECLRGELARDLPEVRGGDALRVQPGKIRLDVLADRRHHHGLPAEELQVVSDVGRASAVFAAHFRREEADVEDMQLVGEDVVLELVREHHDGVVGDRSCNQCAQFWLSVSLLRGVWVWQRAG